MKEYDPLVFLAVFHEMLGPLLWLLPLLALAVTVGFVWVLRREGRLVSRRLLLAEGLGLIGGALALVLMAVVSSSGFTDAAGPADWFLILIVYGVGFVASTVTIYTTLGFLAARLRGTPHSAHADG
ncbi:DUF5368 domain-containing protein [Tepidimonas charontis]|uniref:Uncharacterized protein n=1 Tax=Tepidimonas charontis TaxID=2267262 RepID=A0A554XGP3_9BURK|nr:DUF5368 domain-containing protein [Tepidimonas charontis]TSE34996.1 hypothetical protein Tchar_01054 [Tepidimonas charontis]